jgi:predicted alpha/beta superfamily hydrolase
VCLPAGYESTDDHYPVLYMQDGQNLFDRAIGFGGQEWGVDEALAAHAGRADAIIVAIANAGDVRINEYSPFRDEGLGGGKGDDYLDFISDVVMPLVDGTFRTRMGAENTFIGGSSMGGLIALYAYLTRPDVFGGVAALSPSLWFARRAIFEVLKNTPCRGGRLYADIGSREGPAQLLDMARLRIRLVEKGYRKGRDMVVLMDLGARHEEAAWARRFPKALRFLVGGAKAGRHPSRKEASHAFRSMLRRG